MNGWADKAFTTTANAVNSINVGLRSYKAEGWETSNLQ